MHRCRESFSKSLKQKRVVGSEMETVLSGCVTLAYDEVLFSLYATHKMLFGAGR